MPMPTKTAARTPTSTTSEARPDRSAKAIAWRREQMEHALADSMIERNYPDPEALALFERWVLGELTDAEADKELLSGLHARFAESRAASGH
jgi:hypothetical protein